MVVSVGDVVCLPDEGAAEEEGAKAAAIAAGVLDTEGLLGLVACLFEDEDGEKMAQVRGGGLDGLQNVMQLV